MAKSCIGSFERAARVTLQPSAANVLVIASPIPFEAPVMRALLPCNFRSISLTLLMDVEFGFEILASAFLQIQEPASLYRGKLNNGRG